MIMKLIGALATAFACTLVSFRYLHFLQLESYQLPGYKRTVKAKPAGVLLPPVYVGVAAEVIAYVCGLFLFTMFARGAAPWNIANAISCVIVVLFALWTETERRASKEKKPLKFTNRMKRLTAASAAVAFVASLAVSLTGIPPFILMAAVSLLPAAAACCMAPVEQHINMGLFRDAQATLDAHPDLIKIGITGSFGKTSTKFILASILSEKYCVLATPSSFNTPMGVTTIIRRDLEPRHEIFIAEMGARHKGDVAELVELVHPQYGLLTTVGMQHLETFGNIETIARTKFELIEGLGKEGVAFFASDKDKSGIVDSLYDRAECEKYLVGDPDAKEPCYVKNITCTPNGSSFILVTGGREILLTTPLLGKHNIANIALACCCALRLGLSDAQLVRGVAKLRAVEHRLQLLPSAGGINVIDDAFNANPEGAQEALNVLSAFPGKHIIVTPGFVEQGDMEETLNRELGQYIAKCADTAIIIGKGHADPIVRGALEKGMPESSVLRAQSLTEAQVILGKIIRVGDTVLFENDLPDNYNE